MFCRSDVCGTNDDDDKADDTTTNRIKSETAHAIHPGLKLQEGINKAPVQRTNLEMTSKFLCQPKVVYTGPEHRNIPTFLSHKIRKIIIPFESSQKSINRSTLRPSISRS